MLTILPCPFLHSTPLTHQRFLNRHKGSYGPAIRAGEASFPFPGTPVKGLLVCGDSCFPGIGVPAVAGSGFLAANSVSLDSVQPQMKMLAELNSKFAIFGIFFETCNITKVYVSQQLTQALEEKTKLKYTL